MLLDFFQIGEPVETPKPHRHGKKKSKKKQTASTKDDRTTTKYVPKRTQHPVALQTNNHNTFPNVWTSKYLSWRQGPISARSVKGTNKESTKKDGVARINQNQNSTSATKQIEEKQVTKESITQKESAINSTQLIVSALKGLAMQFFKNNKTVLIIKAFIDLGEVYICARNIADNLSELEKLIKVCPDGKLKVCRNGKLVYKIKKYRALAKTIKSTKGLFDSVVELAKDAAALTAAP